MDERNKVGKQQQQPKDNVADPPPAEGLRRSKRNKYHLDVASLLLSSSSTIRRDRLSSPPPPPTIKATATNSSRRQQTTQATTEAAVTDCEQPPPVAKRRGASTGGGGRTKRTGKEAEDEKGQERKDEAEEPEAEAKVVVQTSSRSISGGAPMGTEDIQLPEQLLEDDPFDGAVAGQNQTPLVPSADGNLLQRTTISAPNAAKQPTTNETGPTISADHSSAATLADIAEGKRKRKAPLRHGEYQIGDEEEEEKLFKTVKVEYTVPKGAKPTDDHSCPKCPAVFDSRVGLTNHLKLHGTKKEFPCELCDFSCTNKKTMRQHRRVHGLSRRSRRSANVQPKGEMVQPVKLEKSSPEMRQPMSPPPQCVDVRAMDRDREIGEAPKRVVKKENDAEEEEEEEGMMPVLEQEQQQGPKLEESDGQAKGRDPVVRDSKAAGGYDRNTVQCPHCPFRTQSNQRLLPHLQGHNRESGFVCSACGFKSESSGFLRRHSQLHVEECKWPPDYVGMPHEKIAMLLVAHREGSEKKVGENSTETDEEEKRENRDEKEEEGGEGKIEEEQKPKEKKAKKKKNMEGKRRMARHGKRTSKWRWSTGTRLISRKAKKGHFAKLPFLICRRCGLHCRSGPACLALHKIRHHWPVAKRIALCRELLTERMAWREDRGTGTGAEYWTMFLSKQTNDAAGREDGQLNSADDSSNTVPKNGGKIFRCRSCPFATDQVFRLQKHENKHLVKSEHQCADCSFSCRSLDILAQHMRLHDKHNNIGQQKRSSSRQSTPSQRSAPSPSVPPITSTSSADPPKLAPIRRSEAHYCPHCPYSSKHNCDMKAHMKMHEERRKFACPFCTYSTKRQNALIAHEQLHRKGPLLGSPAVLGTRGAPCRRLKQIFEKSGSSGKALIGERIRFDDARTHFYRCALKECGQEVPFCADLARHARHHRAEWTRKRKFKCAKCGFGTDMEKRMEAHQNATHGRGLAEDGEKNARTDAGIFMCKECPFATVNYAKFWNHRQKHKRANRFTCPYCSFSSGSAQCYAEHMILHGEPKEEKRATTKEEGKEGKKEETMEEQGKKEEEEEKCKKEQKDEKEENQEQIIATTKSKGTNGVTATITTTAATTQQRRSMDLPPFQRHKFEQFSAALPPAKQMKTMAAKGKEVDALSTDSSSSTSSSSSSSAGSKSKCCPECPFECHDGVLLKLHLEMHRPGVNRPYSCTLCSFSCFSAESLHIHLSMHASATTLEQSVPSSSSSADVATSSSSSVGAATASVQKGASAATAGTSSAPALQCSQCNFKCAEREQFLAHRKEHVQLLQQRLMTIIKRSSGGDTLLSGGIGSGFGMPSRNGDRPKTAGGGRGTSGGGGGSRSQQDKQHYCSRCSFRCDTVQAFTRHWEHHRIDHRSRPGHFRCSACDYSSDTRNVVLFHERNHHLDIPLSSLCRNIELNPFTQSGTNNAAAADVGGTDTKYNQFAAAKSC